MNICYMAEQLEQPAVFWNTVPGTQAGSDQHAGAATPGPRRERGRALAGVCEELGRWEFLFTLSPLIIEGGTGSPVVRPLAG